MSFKDFQCKNSEPCIKGVIETLTNYITIYKNKITNECRLPIDCKALLRTERDAKDMLDKIIADSEEIKIEDIGFKLKEQGGERKEGERKEGLKSILESCFENLHNLCREGNEETTRGQKKYKIKEIQAYLRILPLLANLISVIKENKKRKKKKINKKELEKKSNNFFKTNEEDDREKLRNCIESYYKFFGCNSF